MAKKLNRKVSGLKPISMPSPTYGWDLNVPAEYPNLDFTAQTYPSMDSLYAPYNPGTNLDLSFGKSYEPLTGSFLAPNVEMPAMNLSGLNQVAAAPAIEPTKPGFLKDTWNSLTGFQKIGAVLGLGNAAAGAYNAYNQNKLARDQLNFTKNAFNTQMEASRKMTNADLRDRQQVRARNNPTENMSVEDYMRLNGV